MKSKYYKVVYNDDDKLMSAVVGGRTAVRYKIGKETKPDETLWKLGYGLFIFDNYDDAKRFIIVSTPRSEFNYQIWEIKPGSIIIHNKTLPRSLSLINLRFGRIVKDKISSLWPLGTLMTNSVVLLKQVKNKGCS